MFLRSALFSWLLRRRRYAQFTAVDPSTGQVRKVDLVGGVLRYRAELWTYEYALRWRQRPEDAIKTTWGFAQIKNDTVQALKLTTSGNTHGSRLWRKERPCSLRSLGRASISS
jgi:hypothetical protein